VEALRNWSSCACSILGDQFRRQHLPFWNWQDSQFHIQAEGVLGQVRRGLKKPAAVPYDALDVQDAELAQPISFPILPGPLVDRRALRNVFAQGLDGRVFALKVELGRILDNDRDRDAPWREERAGSSPARDDEHVSRAGRRHEQQRPLPDFLLLGDRDVVLGIEVFTGHRDGRCHGSHP
jgi:hypothetical protein